MRGSRHARRDDSPSADTSEAQLLDQSMRSTPTRACTASSCRCRCRSTSTRTRSSDASTRQGRRRLPSRERRQAAHRRARRVRAVHARRRASSCSCAAASRRAGKEAVIVGRSNIVGQADGRPAAAGCARRKRHGDGLPQPHRGSRRPHAPRRHPHRGDRAAGDDHRRHDQAWRRRHRRRASIASTMRPHERVPPRRRRRLRRRRAQVASHITPVPGGVGPMTIAMLHEEHGSRGGADRRRVSTRRRDGRPSQSLGELELFAPSPPPSRAAEQPRARSRSSRAVPPPPPRAAYVDDSIPGATAGAAVSVMALTATARDVLEGAFMPALGARRGVGLQGASQRPLVFLPARRQCADPLRRLGARPRASLRRRTTVCRSPRSASFPCIPARGEMQFAVTRMEAEGDGLYRKALELTRARLEADGLLDPRRKRALPRYPRRIAVITSRDGAALRRHPSPWCSVAARPWTSCSCRRRCRVTARPSRYAPRSIASRAGARPTSLIIGRGGGAREDLWAFNDERVARALAALPHPDDLGRRPRD